MNRFADLSDDFFLNVHVHTEMDLPQQRETVLHFFEQMQRRYPQLQNLYTREKNELVLEEEKEAGGYRWLSLEPKRLCSGFVNPASLEDAISQHREVLKVAPYELTLSKLDCESIAVIFGFDYTYRGNHNQLLADILGLPTALEGMIANGTTPLLGFEPSIQYTIDEDCKTQVRLNFETRTTAFHVRTGEYGEEQISVYLTVRRFDSLQPHEEFEIEMERLVGIGCDILDSHVIEQVLRPLQQAIATK